jgi:hypothetical protein
MLPFLKQKKEATVSVEPDKIERTPDEGKELDYLEECAGELMAAFKSGDKKALKQALLDFIAIAEMSEGED